MVNIENWDDFAAESERLLLSAPSKTRYTFKYVAKEGVFELKVTDDRTCLKFKSDQKAHIRKMESMTMRFMAIMASEKKDEDIEAGLLPEIQ